ncbi:MAG: hydrolase [Candidatus Thiodiazotropha sp. (ex Lucinoma borealis)]|nr:hydrolase [Candidatus Thiodiazotropha sp. (ex Lucinoma borealis)]MCU7855907.1 hydrolase [Candidatus Thiodiazotropha sp. (ex Lucinoma borealis)]MCU7868541.1 hydrolase [Candidatus Thiodiazotropha sp. (ex Lucinoma borealis)]
MPSKIDHIKQYMALALQPVIQGAHKRDDIVRNLDHITELSRAAVWLSAIDLPVKLVTIPEGALQGFTDEIFDWDHVDYVERSAIDIPGKETEYLGELARDLDTFIIAQAKAKHPEFPERFFNCAFVIDPKGEVIHVHYKMQVFAREHSTVPHDVWERWTELYGTGLDAFFPVTDTEIGRIGCIICMEGSYPETARGLAMNGAEIVYRPSYPEPYVANGLWEIQNRARALDNTMYVIAPNPAAYAPLPESQFPIDTFGGNSMIVDYQGRVISNHKAGGSASYSGAIVDIDALRQYRARSRWGNWLKDLRTEQFRLIYDEPLYEQNRCLTEPPLKHGENDKIVAQATQRMFDRDIWKRPSYLSDEEN